MGPAMEGELPPLSERLSASVDTTDERLLICVCVLMLAEILRQCEHLVAELTWKGLLSRMDVVVALERKFGCETLAASGELTLVHPRSNLDTLRPSKGARTFMVHFAILKRLLVLMLLF